MPQAIPIIMKVVVSVVVSKVVSVGVTKITGSEELGMIAGMVAGGYAAGAIGGASTTAGSVNVSDGLSAAEGATLGSNAEFASFMDAPFESIGDVSGMGSPTAQIAASQGVNMTDFDYPELSSNISNNGLSTIAPPEPPSMLQKFGNAVGEGVDNVSEGMNKFVDNISGSSDQAVNKLADVGKTELSGLQKFLPTPDTAMKAWGASQLQKEKLQREDDLAAQADAKEADRISKWKSIVDNAKNPQPLLARN